TPHVRFRAGLWRREANMVAAERLGIRVVRPRPVACCPRCGRWVPFFQLEGHEWACQYCAAVSVRGPWVRIGLVGAYRALGIWDRHARGLRRRLAVRLLDRATRTRTYRDVLVLGVGAAVIGREPLDWTGPRLSSPRSISLPCGGTPSRPPGSLHNAPSIFAPYYVDALCDA